MPSCLFYIWREFELDTTGNIDRAGPKLVVAEIIHDESLVPWRSGIHPPTAGFAPASRSTLTSG